MEHREFAGPLLRMFRLERNWSQETLCHGICAVSYLSKIEQGKADPNQELLSALFQKLQIEWKEDPEDISLRDRLYEGIFSWDGEYTRQQMKLLEERRKENRIGPCYLDFAVIRAYWYNRGDKLPREMLPLLDRRQRCLEAIVRNDHEEAYRCYPCALTAFCIAEEAFLKGNYTYCLEYLQIAYEQASREGYVYIMMICQSYMANCYADIGNLEAMHRHNQIAARMARAMGDQTLLETIAYNTAATKLEFGDFEAGYRYFSKMENHSALSLHKLAISCEGLGKNQEALDALNEVQRMDAVDGLDRDMCALVRYRLEHPDYLQDPEYGPMLMNTFQRIRAQRHYGFARFHLRWVTQWLTANRKYQEAFRLMRDFTGNTF